MIAFAIFKRYSLPMNPLIRNEELKREHGWSSQERWRLVQEALDWAEAQSTVKRNDPKNRLMEEARKNAAILMGLHRHTTTR